MRLWCLEVLTTTLVNLGKTSGSKIPTLVYRISNIVSLLLLLLILMILIIYITYVLIGVLLDTFTLYTS